MVRARWDRTLDEEGNPHLRAAVAATAPLGSVTIDIPRADAVFITQSAFAKFVIPYYTRFKSPAQIAAMKHKYFADGFIGVAHFPPSIQQGIPPHGSTEDEAPENLHVVLASGQVTPSA